jgi:hypothetical protein
MANMLGKYLGGIGGIAFTFASFIACGSQMYKVSVHEDIDSTKTETASPHANDKTSTLYGIHAAKGWNGVHIPFKFGKDMTEQQKIHLMAAIQRWEWAVGKKLFAFEGDHAGVTGDSFKDLYSSLQDNVNGHYLDNNWAKTGKPDDVLATTIWNNGFDASIIAKADIRFNTQNYLIGDSMTLKAKDNKDVVDMQSLALHELGHLLGLAHISEDVDSLSIMNPALFIGEGLATRELSPGDIERIQTVYGCEGKACDIGALLKEQETADWEKLTLTAQAWIETKAEESPKLQLN